MEPWRKKGEHENLVLGLGARRGEETVWRGERDWGRKGRWERRLEWISGMDIFDRRP